MAVANQRGIVSRRALVLVAAVLGVGALMFGPLRSWARDLLDANVARTTEFDRRVEAQRLGAIKAELAEAGIEVESAAGAAESIAPAPAPVEVEPGWRARVARWWRRVRGIPEPIAPAPLPVLPDSLGLRPGERMFLPDGRVIHYDSSTFRMQR